MWIRWIRIQIRIRICNTGLKPRKDPPGEYCADFLRLVLSFGVTIALKKGKGKSYTYFSINNLGELQFLGHFYEQFKED